MKKYFIEIFESYYEDNYIEGQVSPFNTIKIEEKSFETLADAIEHFKNTYGENYPLELDENGDIICPVDMRRSNERYGFERATEEEKKKFEAGKINLYNVEYLMTIHKVDKVEAKELENLL